MRQYDNSNAMMALAECVTPGGGATLSKQPHNYPRGAHPLLLREAHGCRVVDVDGNEYVDWLLALASTGLGWGHTAVVDAVKPYLGFPSLSLPHPLEQAYFEKMIQVIPCAEMIRTVKTGSESTEAAARIARAYTGRDVILSSGYHGWGSQWAGTNEYCPGVPAQFKDMVRPFGHNDLERAQRLAKDTEGRVAAVIVEPTLLEPPAPGYLEGLRALCDEIGALLVFDEMITAFRWALSGGQEYFGVTPDLACFGKACASGYPLAFVAGRRDVMERWGRLVSGTYGGELVSIAAADATLRVYQERGVVAHMWRIGRVLQDELRAVFAGYRGGPSLKFSVTGYPVHPRVAVHEGTGPIAPDDLESVYGMSLLLQQLAEHGVLIHPAGFNVSLAHDEAALRHTTLAFRAALDDIAGGVSLRGELYKPGTTALRLWGHK